MDLEPAPNAIRDTHGTIALSSPNRGVFGYRTLEDHDTRRREDPHNSLAFSVLNGKLQQ
jgi:hypothetical protein